MGNQLRRWGAIEQRREQRQLREHAGARILCNEKDVRVIAELDPLDRRLKPASEIWLPVAVFAVIGLNAPISIAHVRIGRLSGPMKLGLA
jgi:hypothetical protein